MTRLRSFAEAEALLARYVPLTRHITGKDITIDRTRHLMAVLGNPHEQLKIIHIAGTSGKTSTAYYTAALLTLTGKKVGLTVSPHIDSVTERVQINMQLLSEDQFVAALNEFMEIIERTSMQPTYFELLVAFAYWYFARKNVDYAVVETGMGGLHDSTNVAANPDKVCVVTDIGLDHMHVLGNTVSEIARQKAGIIHPENKVFMYDQAPEINRVFKDWCKEQKAELLFLDEASVEAGVNLKTLPVFQRRNWLLAYRTYKYIESRDKLPTLDNDKLEKSFHIQVPGRMDEVRIDDKIIVMDGAHNEQKMQAFARSFQKRYMGQKVPVLLSLKEGKELNAVLPLLKPITHKLIITSYKTSQDLPVASIDTRELAAAAQRFGFADTIQEPDMDKAYELLKKEPGEVAIITGSFYLIGQLRHNHTELRHG